jgi:hypothetical protein
MAKKQFSPQKSGPGSLAGKSEKSLLRMSAKWPLLECLMTEDWQRRGNLVQICVARQSLYGHVAAGVVLMDLGCLGAKNAYASVFSSLRSYKTELIRPLRRLQTLTPHDLDLVAKVIQEGVRYATDLGFKPNRDLPDALLVIGDTHPENVTTPIPLGGEDGRPFYFAGPHDDHVRIQRVLNRKVGPDNYTFIIPIGAPGFDGWEDDNN